MDKPTYRSSLSKQLNVNAVLYEPVGRKWAKTAPATHMLRGKPNSCHFTVQVFTAVIYLTDQVKGDGLTFGLQNLQHPWDLKSSWSLYS